MAGLLMRRMPHAEIAIHLGRVLRSCAEFKPASPAGSVDTNRRISVVARQLAEAIDNSFAMVIHTDQGQWGVHEPDPAGPARWPEGYNSGAHDGSATRFRISGP